MTSPRHVRVVVSDRHGLDVIVHAVVHPSHEGGATDAPDASEVTRVSAVYADDRLRSTPVNLDRLYDDVPDLDEALRLACYDTH